MNFGTRKVLLVLLAVVTSTVSFAAAGEDRLTIGTGGVAGIYHQIGASICRFIEMRQKSYNFDCQTVPTGGSVENLQALRDGSFELAVVQSDLQHDAYFGTSEFESAGPNRELRALFSVVPESFTVIAGEDSGISTLKDLEGRRVNVGNPGSGQRVAMKKVMQRLGWTMDSFEVATEMESAIQSGEICRRKLDAAVYLVAHPNLSVKEAATCNSVLIPVVGPEIDGLIADNPHYVNVEILANHYTSNAGPIPSFGVTATVVATSATSPEVAYQVVKAVFENLEEFRTLLPAFANLDTNFMLSPHHAAPWHPGALKYFKEAGMM